MTAEVSPPKKYMQYSSSIVEAASWMYWGRATTGLRRENGAKVGHATILTAPIAVYERHNKG